MLHCYFLKLTTYCCLIRKCKRMLSFGQPCLQIRNLLGTDPLDNDSRLLTISYLHGWAFSFSPFATSLQPLPLTHYTETQSNKHRLFSCFPFKFSLSTSSIPAYPSLETLPPPRNLPLSLTLFLPLPLCLTSPSPLTHSLSSFLALPHDSSFRPTSPSLFFSDCVHFCQRCGPLVL
jgi:hypothetical protein